MQTTQIQSQKKRMNPLPEDRMNLEVPHQQSVLTKVLCPPISGNYY